MIYDEVSEDIFDMRNVIIFLLKETMLFQNICSVA